MRACQCPNCNAHISLDDSRDFGFCQYCGTKIMLDDYRSTHRVVDEARIHETETDRIIRLKELELEEKKREREHKEQKWIMIGWAFAGGVAFLIIMIMAILESSGCI